MPRPSGTILLLTALVVAAIAAHGQAIVLGQPQMNFAASPGQNSSVQVLPIQITGTTSVPYLVTFTPQSGGNWLYFSPSFGNLPANVLMLASATNLSAGTYTGLLTITAPAATNSPVYVPVVFSVGQSTIGTVTVSPSTFTFTGKVNGVAPPPQLMQVNVATSPFGYAISAMANSGGGWLQVNPPQGTAPSQVAVSVVTQGLGPGYYYGTLTVTPSIGAPVVIPVTLVMTTSSTLNLSTSNLMFYYQTGGTYPPAQAFTIYADLESPIPFSLAPATVQGNWLTGVPLVGNAPRTIAVAADPTGLAPGTYAGSITVAGGTSLVATQNLGVTLLVSNSPLLTLGTPPAAFNYTTGGVAPPSQSIDIDSTAGPLAFSVNAATVGGNWLSVGPVSGTTPKTLAIGVNPTGLSAGVYSGLVTVTSPGIVDSPQSFPVTLNVNTVQTLSTVPTALVFNYQIGVSTDLSGQSIQVNTALPANVTVAASTTNCGSWLVAGATTVATPGNVTISINPSVVVTPQVCNGTVTLSLAGLDPVQIPVVLNVSRSALLNLAPTSLDFVVDYGVGNSSTKTITLTTTDGTKVPFIATPSVNTTWLNVAPSLASAPNVLTVSFYPGMMTPGKYSGSILLTSQGVAGTLAIPVNVTVRPVTTTTATPAALSFVQSVGGSVPPAQQVQIATGGDSYPFTVTTLAAPVGGWLLATPVVGSSPVKLNITAVGTNLAVGSYNGSVRVSVPGSSNDPLVIPVNLTVTTASALTVAPAGLVFNYQLGSLFGRPDQTLTITSSGTTLAYTASASVSGSGNWLTVRPASGITRGQVTVTVNPSGLAAGTYNGQVVITSGGAVGSPVIVPVTLTVQAQPAPILNTLTSAASGLPGAVSPGQIVTLKGSGLGPATGVGPVLTSAGKVDTTVAFTRVYFDTFLAPILYTSASQINAVVPYELAGRTTVQVLVENQGMRSLALTANVAATAPGIFTSDSTGAGQGAILNQDYSINSASTPAAQGSVIQIFATGEGQTLPLGDTGSVTGATLALPLAKVSAKVGDQPAEVLYAGSAPGAVAGLFQVNVRVPSGITGNDVKVVIKVGDAESQPGVTVAVR